MSDELGTCEFTPHKFNCQPNGRPGFNPCVNWKPSSPAAVPAQPELGKCGWLEGMPRPSHPNGIPHARRDDCAVWQSASAPPAQPDAVERELAEELGIELFSGVPFYGDRGASVPMRVWAALVKERRERKRL